MKQEIKNRIKDINNGIVPNGYKKTEFGVFPCDWVTDKRLKDIGTFGKGKGLPGGKMISEGVPCVGYGDIYMKYNNFHFEKAESFVDEETASESQPIQKGTLLFTGTGETAEEIGKCVCYNGDETIYAGGDIITFISNEVKPLFLAYQQYQDFSLRNKASFGQGHSVVHIHADNLEKLNVAYPKSADEQSKIAEILMKWDEAIELYNQYIEKLKQLKSICLKKMFPKKGERVPEWRFKGFTDAWEQRKLGETAQIIMGQSPDGSTYSDFPTDYILVQGNADLENGWVKPRIWTTQKTKYAVAGDLIMSVRAPAGSMGKTAYNVVLGRGVAAIKGNEFIFQVLTKMDLEGFWKKLSAGSTFESLNSDNIINANINLPSNLEQDKIGSIFENIDNLITLHQCKVEKIKAQQKVLQKYLLNGIVRV